MSETCSFRAYSLPEVLITLLIISLIASLALAKMVKYKSRSNSVTHYWMCKRDKDGKYIVDTSAAGAGGAKSDHCEFISPTNFKSLKVNVVGGGGGGASGRGVLDQVTYTNGEHSYIPSNTGTYYIILIGGGGQGGGSECYSAQGGGSGGVIAGEFTLDKDVTYKLNIGRGGTGNNYGGVGGSATTMSGGGLNLSAGGGQGGVGRNRNWGCHKHGGDGYGGSISGGPGMKGVRGGSKLADSIYTSRVASSAGVDKPEDGGGPWTTPGQVCVTNWETNNTNCFFKMEQFLGENVSQRLGAGGAGLSGQGCGGAVGGNGFAKIMYSPVYGGGGGLSGVQSFSEIKKSMGKVKVYVGEGGKGATSPNAPGNDGEASRFGDIVIASGGEGGKTMVNNANISGNNASPLAAGTEGDKTPAQNTISGLGIDGSIPLGGKSGGNSSLNGETVWGGPGSGGGGGAGAASGTGAGSNGAYGAVIVTW